MTYFNGYNYRISKMNYKLLLIASLLFVIVMVNAEEDISSEIDEVSDELKEVVPDEDENEILDKDDLEQMKQQV